MATIRPFAALRFSLEAGPLKDLVAPPYDVLSQEQRDELGAKSPFNTVWLTLPESNSDDRSKFIKYGRSSSRLAHWREDGQLKLEGKPAFYRYSQTFVNPADGKTYSRTGLVVLIKVEPYEKGVVLPHEQTFPKHKEDRLRLLEATRTHLECIYGLYEDSGGNVVTAISSAPFEVIADTTTEDGIRHELARCMDESANAAISSSFAPERIWIADGHHRYETAVNFRAALGEQSGEVPEDYMMIALSSMSDPGLVLLPTHRMISCVKETFDIIEQKLQTKFNTRSMANNELPAQVSALDQAGTRVFGIALPGGRGILATLEEPNDAVKWIPGDGSSLLKTLDVSVIHEVILPEVFGVEGTDRIGYTRDASEALAKVEDNEDTVAIITNPPSVDDMRRIALGGEKMPQKSTFYYPKLLSGLVFWQLSDFK